MPSECQHSGPNGPTPTGITRKHQITKTEEVALQSSREKNNVLIRKIDHQNGLGFPIVPGKLKDKMAFNWNATPSQMSIKREGRIKTFADVQDLRKS